MMRQKEESPAIPEKRILSARVNEISASEPRLALAMSPVLRALTKSEGRVPSDLRDFVTPLVVECRTCSRAGLSQHRPVRRPAHLPHGHVISVLLVVLAIVFVLVARQYVAIQGLQLSR